MKITFKRSVKIVAVLFVLMFIAGCATSEKYRAILNQWHGHSIDEFTQMWGYPDKTLKLENDQTAYVYSDKEIVSTPLTQMPSNITTVKNGDKTTVISTPGTIVGGQTYSLSCTTWVVFNNKTKQIINTTFRGNNCVAY
ncbi:hypothetical protein [Fangia hongkongensis]|uniref:hypothetical protein n=1 Tax=Fangia hongkongensis TaxID=270495 RepID=UPI000379E8C6|nr:hypothetical protein [Fangia hongkongensis]MBK2124316.1 hypothetical protein [Fangia hongkongensis]